MDSTLRWYASLVHDKHKVKSGEAHFADCDYWPCAHLRLAILKGIPTPYTELDGSGTY